MLPWCYSCSYCISNHSLSPAKLSFMTFSSPSSLVQWRCSFIKVSMYKLSTEEINPRIEINRSEKIMKQIWIRSQSIPQRWWDRRWWPQVVTGQEGWWQIHLPESQRKRVHCKGGRPQPKRQVQNRVNWKNFEGQNSTYLINLVHSTYSWRQGGLIIRII